MTKPLLKVERLCRYFRLDRTRVLRAVDDVSFEIARGEILGIVGESGCGKSTLGRTILGLHPLTSGKVLFDGRDVHAARGAERLRFKRRAQIVLQDSYESLNPRMTIGEIVAEGLEAHRIVSSKKEREGRVCRLLERMGLSPMFRSRFPHELSGGQRQRVGIARALAVEPEFLVCDEPISALDVSVQAQIVNLFASLREELGLTLLFIAHDLAMVRHLSDRVGVLYMGGLVELAPTSTLYSRPLHPYTRALLSSIPDVDPDNPLSGRRIKLSGEVTSPIGAPKGCRFAPRCPLVTPLCRDTVPDLVEAEPGHLVACHLAAPSE
ncbi:MAG: ABC transporter ATP-binding protein [Fretibacterium sp.]|nr:ABC transporter ATP-binding protein [Fretibacterium sp.]